MKIRYDIKVSIANKIDGTSSTFPAKTLEADITAANDNLLYDNNHVIAENVYLFDIFKDEVAAYSSALGVPVTDLEFDSFEVIALAPPDQYQVYFEFESERQKQDLRPTIKVYIGPKEKQLNKPVLVGMAIDKNTLVWSWNKDDFAHYLVTEPIDPTNPDDQDKIVAQLPIGVSEYVETGLEAGTPYTRRLISYTDTQVSELSSPCTAWTETVHPNISLKEYETPRLYDFDVDESQRNTIEERMKAFHSGVGDFSDLKVYKQMDADFYQKFRAYFEITGRRVQRERRYDQVGFWYKVCMDGYERVDEQEGEVTFDIYACPREWLRLEDYVWATKDVTVQAEFEATVFLQKEEATEVMSPLSVYECNIEHKTEVTPGTSTTETIPHKIEIETQFLKPSCVIISIDLSGSMDLAFDSTHRRIDKIQEEVCNFIMALNKKVIDEVAAFNTRIDNEVALLDPSNPCITELNNSKISETAAKNLMQYIIIGWGGYTHANDHNQASGMFGAGIIPGTPTTDYQAAINAVNNMAPRDYGAYTSFLGGFRKSIEAFNAYCSDRDVVGQFFFTDGLCNVTEGYTYWPLKTEEREGPDFKNKFTNYVANFPTGFQWVDNPQAIINHTCSNDGIGAQKILVSVQTGIKEVLAKGMNLYIIFGTESDKNEYIDTFYTESNCYGTKSFAAALGSKIKCLSMAIIGEDHVYFPSNANGDWSLNGSGDGLCDIMQNALLKVFPKDKKTFEWYEENTMTLPPETTEWDEFKGWGPEPIRIDGIAKYNIDSMASITIKGGPYYFTFTNDVDCTPVGYSSKERRAVVKKVLSADPDKNYYVDENGNKVMLLDEIMRLVEESPEFAAGYTNLVKTSDGKTMIKGLFIKDNYAIGDEDINYDEGWNYGMEGSVNSFTQVDYGESDSYGDDCYLIDENSVLQIQGYTDAMIFDGEHSVSAELNAYDFPWVNVIHSDGSVVVDNGTDISCNEFMFNRKDKTIQYDGNGPYSHCINVVKCDRDIQLNGISSYVSEDGDANYRVFDPMTTDITGEIDLWYKSPVLNYRFNLEDPDAKTSIYEILPDCIPTDKYLHVVLLHVYYARNVYISDGPNPESLNGTPQSGFNYVDAYGDSPIAYEGYPNLLDDNPDSAEGLYKWTTKMWQDPSGYDNGWYLDTFVWFQAEKMKKDRPYHYELPKDGMEPYYGLVNGRYTSYNQDGRQDLLVQVPQFNMPTTVKDYYIHYGGSSIPINWNGDGTHPLKIYIEITEFHPKDALISYKWDKDCRWINPETGKVNDDITQDYKGCYATFSCDSIVYKDIEYYDLVQTINFENQEVFDTKDNTIHYQLQRPETDYTYLNFYLNVITDNGDVLALTYPNELIFDEYGNADFGVTYKGVVNATTKWSPRIHNGYYYLNQHEYFAYSEFNFDHERTNVERNTEEQYVTVFGHMTFDVSLCHRAAEKEIYRGNNAVVKEGRSSLLQDESHFIWVDGKGLTLKPSVDGEYYKEYTMYMYYSPVITFSNRLSVHGPVSFQYEINDGTTEIMGVEVRSFSFDNGKWTEWYPLAGVQVPCYPNTSYALPTEIPCSHAYQYRFYLQPSLIGMEKSIEDYLCCYLDWKDEQDEDACYNISTITDHITTIDDENDGVFVSRIFDFGCRSTMYLEVFESCYNANVKVYGATSNRKDDLRTKIVTWNLLNANTSMNGRYMRYKIVIPGGEKVYWLHKNIFTEETDVTLPYLQSITMEGEFHPQDVITNFINTEAFEFIADGQYHEIEEFSDLTKVIGDDVLDRGFTMDEIKKVDIKCTTSNIQITYNSNLLNEYPTATLTNTGIKAKTPIQTRTEVTYTPFIYLDDDDAYDKITIYGATPQQYCPITVEDPEGRSYIQLHNCHDFEQTYKVVCKEKTKYIELPTNRYDAFIFSIRLNDDFLDSSQYKVVNHLIIFNDFLSIGDSIKVSYFIMYSFYAEIDRYGGNDVPPSTTIYLFTGYAHDSNGTTFYIPPAPKYKVYFETGLRNNKFVANKLSLNPLYRTDYRGFIFLTDDPNEPYTVRLYCNPLRIKAGGYDKVDVIVEVLDILGNPVINRKVFLDCGASDSSGGSFDRGIIDCDNDITDMNGVVHFIYESSVLPTQAKIRASVFNCAGTSIEDSVTITNY